MRSRTGGGDAVLELRHAMAQALRQVVADREELLRRQAALSALAPSLEREFAIAVNHARESSLRALLGRVRRSACRARALIALGLSP